MKLLPTALLLALVPTSTARAQTPWVDGELIVRSLVAGTQTQVLYRIAPETGDAQELLSGFFWSGGPASLAFDPHRQALVTNMGIAPSLQQPKAWFVDASGALNPIPALDGEFLRAITPIGDGRIYYQRSSANPNGVINYLDADDSVQTLLDSTGSAPFESNVERMIYHPPTNALIAANANGTATSLQNNCQPTGSSVFRIPLAPDGSRVAGPVVCDSLVDTGSIVGLDYLPGGDLLLQMTGGQFFTQTTKRVDPFTLASSVFAAPQPIDLNGGLWSARIGRAIVLDDASNVLRSYSENEVGAGTIIPTTVAVAPNTTGNSSTETMIELDRFDPTCAGTTYAYGTGLAGTGGFVPALEGFGCADVGTEYSVRIDGVVGAGLGVLSVGFTPSELPLFGGTLYVLPAFTLLLSADGAAGAPGAGSVELTHTYGSPSFIGIEIYFQAGFLDAAAPEGLSLSNALLISVG